MKGMSRLQIGFVSSLGVHLLVVVLVSFLGIFSVVQDQEQIVEVTMFSGGGGGGKNETTVTEEPGTKDTEKIAPQEIPMEKNIVPESSDNITEISSDATEQSINHNKNSTKEVESNFQAQNSGRGTGMGSGSGSGLGSGMGSGSGSGLGTGSGIGSGSGSGSGSEAAVPPRLIKQRPPEYPATARQAEIEGTVLVKIVVARDGSVKQASVAETSGASSLDQAAVRAVESWRFIAAQDHFGQAVRCYTYIPISFSLK